MFIQFNNKHIFITFLNNITVPDFVSYSLKMLFLEVMAKGSSSLTAATDKNVLAFSDVWSLKKPIMATLFASINSLASLTEVRSLAGGPVFLINQLTMSSACRPPVQ